MIGVWGNLSRVGEVMSQNSKNIEGKKEMSRTWKLKFRDKIALPRRVYFTFTPQNYSQIVPKY